MVSLVSSKVIILEINVTEAPHSGRLFQRHVPEIRFYGYSQPLDCGEVVGSLRVISQ